MSGGGEITFLIRILSPRGSSTINTLNQTGEEIKPSSFPSSAFYRRSPDKHLSS